MKKKTTKMMGMMEQEMKVLKKKMVKMKQGR
jgi:hypothetical protein